MQKLVLYSLANFSIFTINIKNDPKQKVSRTFHRYGWRSLFINLSIDLPAKFVTTDANMARECDLFALHRTFSCSNPRSEW